MVKIGFINFIVLLFFVLFIESLGWLVLSFDNQSRPFLFDPSFGHDDLSSPGKINRMRYLDPLLGWGHDPEVIDASQMLGTDYALLGSEDKRAMRLVITGGSTSDSMIKDKTWPKFLAQILEANGYCVKLTVGGIPAFSASQEMLKIIRDHHKLDPDLHISYSGANEYEKDWNYLSTPYQSRLTESIAHYRRSFFMPNTVWALAKFLGSPENKVMGINHGLEQPESLSLRWFNNIKTMKAVAHEFDYEFIAILQPLLGMGKYNPMDFELERIKEMNLVENWSPFYKGARALSEQANWLYDFVDVFEHEGGLFTSDCHLNDEGNELIAKRMYDLLITEYKNLLGRYRIQGCY